MTEREADTIQQSRVEEIQARWDWLTEDIEDDNERLSTQRILETSYQEMVREGKGLLFGGVLEKFLVEEQEVQEIIEKYNGHYVEDFEEGYAENFEEERNVEIFKQEKKEQKNYTIPIVKFPPLTSIPSVQPMAAPSDHIYYVKPVFGEGKHQ
jgi:hypothetical protein